MNKNNSNASKLKPYSTIEITFPVNNLHDTCNTETALMLVIVLKNVN